MLRCILPSVHGPGSVPKLGASGSWNLRLKLSKILEIHIIHTYPYCPQGVNQILQGLSYYCICPFLSCNRSEYRQLLLRSVEVTPGLRTIHPPRAMLLWRSFSGLCMFFSFNYVSTMFQLCFKGVEVWKWNGAWVRSTTIALAVLDLASGSVGLVLLQKWVDLLTLSNIFELSCVANWGGVAATRDPCCPGMGDGWKRVGELVLVHSQKSGETHCIFKMSKFGNSLAIVW